MKKTLIILVILFIPCNLSIGFPGIGGWAGGLLDKGVGIAGLPGKIMFGGATSDMSDKLNSNIDHLDAVLSKNAKDAIGNFDNVLKMREEQLNNLLASNIKSLDSSITKNIKVLDISVKKGILGLDHVSRFFDKGLGKVVSITAMLLIFVLVIYFIFESYKNINESGGLNKREFLELIKRSKFYIILLFLSFFIIFLLQPLFGNFIDEEFNDIVAIKENDLTTNLKTLNFEDGCIDIGYLTEIDPGNKHYAYTKYKVNTVKYLLNLTNDKTLISSDLIKEYELMKSSHSKTKNIDPEFFIVNALFYKYYENTKLGQLKAVIECIKYIENKSKLGKQLFTINLEPYAISILNKYFINPYDIETLNSILLKENIKLSKKEIEMLNNDSTDDLLKIQKNYPSLEFDKNVYYILDQDQQYFYEYLIGKKNNDSDIIDNWLQQLRFLENTENKKYYSHNALNMNDYLAYGLLKGRNNPRIDSLENATIAVIDNNKDLIKMKNNITNIFSFKKNILCSLVKNISDTNNLAKPTYANLVINETDFFYAKIDSLKYYSAIRASGKNEFEILRNYEKAIIISSELNLYYRKSELFGVEKIKRPLAYFFIDDAKRNLSSEFKKDAKIEMRLKNIADRILEKTFFR